MASDTVASPISGGWVRRFYGSTIGKKVVMAVTGFIGLGFLIVHTLGNVLIYAGAEKLDHYSALLKSNPALVWAVRGTLVLAVLLHVHAALGLTVLARQARPARYAKLKPQAATIAARTMRAGGVVLLVFIVFHILHFTTGTVHPSFVEGAVYANIVSGFQVTGVAIFYIVAMIALGLHLRHGAWSFFQTLGLNHPHLDGFRRGFAWVLAIAISVGLGSIPIAVLLGYLR